jgi:hypothetical protein
MMETPSARIIAAANATIIAQDSEGRTLELHRMTALDRLRLFKTVGAELAQNTPYLGMAMLAASVSAIDGIPIPPPATEAQLEALVHRLGDHGIAAVAATLSEAMAAPIGNTTQGN